MYSFDGIRELNSIAHFYQVSPTVLIAKAKFIIHQHVAMSVSE